MTADWRVPFYDGFLRTYDMGPKKARANGAWQMFRESRFMKSAQVLMISQAGC